MADLIAEQEQQRGSGGTSSRWVVSSLGEVAQLVGVELQTVKEWRTGADKMPGTEGRWDIIQIFRWRCERLKANAGNVKTQEQRDLELRELAAEVASKELKLRKARGELISRDASKAATASILNEARVQLEAIPSILGASIPPDLRSDLVHELEQQIKLICRKMASKATE